VLISGLRFGLPRLSGCSPGPVSEGSGENVVNLSNAPGCRPDCPIAARRRSVEIRLVSAEWPQLDRALGMKDSPALGYHTPWDVFPKALLRS
jgi:hypothetical protein